MVTLECITMLRKEVMCWRFEVYNRYRNLNFTENSPIFKLNSSHVWVLLSLLSSLTTSILYILAPLVLYYYCISKIILDFVFAQEEKKVNKNWFHISQEINCIVTVNLFQLLNSCLVSCWLVGFHSHDNDFAWISSQLCVVTSDD